MTSSDAATDTRQRRSADERGGASVETPPTPYAAGATDPVVYDRAGFDRHGQTLLDLFEQTLRLALPQR